MSTSTQPEPPGLAGAGANRSAPASRLGANSTRTLLAAIELGILGDYLLRAGSVGINITIWCWALLAAGIFATADVAMDRRRVTLLIAAAFFAAVPAWRSDEVLVLFSGLAVVVLLVLLTWTAGLPEVVLAGRAVSAYIAAAWTAFVHIIAGAVPLIGAEARARADTGEAYRRPAGAVLRGLVLAVPVLLVFATLLMQADAVYASLLRGVFRWDTGTILSHVALTLVFAWLAAAYFTASIQWTRTAPTAAWTFRIGAIETATVLALVDVLFLSFVIVQARYLFGGVSHVLETVGLTYAEYARRGFFELVAVSALALPLLIVATSATRLETLNEKRVHRVLTTVLVGLLLLMMGSALSRMWLYQAEYGWTLSRVHATTLMLWLGGSILWFFATAVRGSGQRFMIGSISGGLAMLAALVIVNPAAAIVRANASRVSAGNDFDGIDAARLGADGLPALLAALPAVASQLDVSERCAVRAAIARAAAGGTGEAGDEHDWRTWALSRERARGAVARSRGLIDVALGPSQEVCNKAGEGKERPAPG